MKAHPLNQRLKRVFDREFEHMGNRTTYKARAELLGVEPPVYSQYLHGHRTLTREKALQFARALRKGCTAKQIEELATELESAKAIDDSRETNVTNWFSQRLGTESLLLVEFREPPETRPFSPGSHLAGKVAEAIVGGMTYAMLYPYCPEKLPALPAPLSGYLRKLDDVLHATYWTIMRLVLDQVCHEHGRHKVELFRAAERLKLYRLRNSSEAICPGLGYRLFYFEPKAGPHESQHWQWVSSGGQELMLRKESDAQALEATAIRYFPLPEYWRKYSRLPARDSDMAAFAKKQAAYRAQLRLSGVVPWTVDEAALNGILTEYLSPRRHHA